MIYRRLYDFSIQLLDQYFVVRTLIHVVSLHSCRVQKAVKSTFLKINVSMNFIQSPNLNVRLNVKK